LTASANQNNKASEPNNVRLNILLMTPSFHQGGSERQGLQLARLLSETGRYNVTLACLDRSGVLLPEAESLALDEIPEFRLNNFYDPNMVRQLRRCVRLLKARSIDVVQTFDFYTNVFGLTAAALARVPLRVGARRNTKGHFSATQTWLERRAFQFAHIIAANAEAVRQELIRDGVRAAKVITTYNGVNLNRVTPIAQLDRARMLNLLGLPPDAEQIVSIVANLRSVYKDHATFIRAARMVKEVFPKAIFVLAGEGPLVEEIREMARQSGLEQQTFLLGRCLQVAELLSVSEVCVLSSKAGEGFSNAIIEYMIAARPVVATDVGGAREAVVEGETGWIMSPGDHEKLATHVIELLRDPERARAMGARGREVVKQKFSCEAQLARIEDLYSRMLRKTETSEPEEIDHSTSHLEIIR
jgi:glycosyltransferase involved in cell wall biosynthesis